MAPTEPDPVDDATLVARSLDEDRAAFGLLVERHRAVRAGAPILVAAEVMDHIGVTPGEGAGYDFLPQSDGERWVSLPRS